MFVCLFVGNYLRTRILRHMAFELNLNMRSDGFVKVQDLLKLDLKTFANIPLRLHTIDDIKEVSSGISFSIYCCLVFLYKTHGVPCKD